MPDRVRVSAPGLLGRLPDSRAKVGAVSSPKGAGRLVRCREVEPRMAIRFLLADDDAGFRATLRQLLERRVEAQVLGEARNGEEAIRLTNDLHPDVVLMDLAMPRMNGLEATRQLKARWPDLAVI
ncbi:MAG: nreC, partial [candidate division NC10 bacterium]|nr:nreC [candidate division NC10 bacterium]